MIKSQNAEINKDESEIDDAEITADQVDRLLTTFLTILTLV